LLPEQQERRDLMKTTITDAGGNFTIRNVPPGSYRAFAVNSPLMQSFFDPAVTQKLASSGKAVDIAASQTTSIDLKVLSTVNR